MEQHEGQEPLKWSCEACGAEYFVSDNNTALYVFPTQPDFTFAQFDCEDAECENSAKYFLDEAGVDMLAKHITNIYPQYDVPDWVVEGYAELHKNDDVIEIEASPEVLAVNTLLTNWDNFVEFIEPWEIIEWGHYRVDKHEV